MSNHSLRTVVTDTFTAPRWVHHLFKVLVGLLVVVVSVLVLRAHWSDLMKVLILSLVWFVTTKAAATLDRDHRFLYFSPDIICDLSLHLMPVAVMVGITVEWLYGVIALVALGVIYFVTYPDASP